MREKKEKDEGRKEKIAENWNQRHKVTKTGKEKKKKNRTKRHSEKEGENTETGSEELPSEGTERERKGKRKGGEKECRKTYLCKNK